MAALIDTVGALAVLASLVVQIGLARERLRGDARTRRLRRWLPRRLH